MASVSSVRLAFLSSYARWLTSSDLAFFARSICVKAVFFFLTTLSSSLAAIVFSLCAFLDALTWSRKILHHFLADNDWISYVSISHNIFLCFFIALLSCFRIFPGTRVPVISVVEMLVDETLFAREICGGVLFLHLFIGKRSFSQISSNWWRFPRWWNLLIVGHSLWSVMFRENRPPPTQNSNQPKDQVHEEHILRAIG